MKDTYTEAASDFLGWIKYVFYAVFIYVDLNTDAVKILFYLMAMDTLCGIGKAARVPELRFRFKELYLGFLAKLLILFVPMAVALVGKGLSFDFSGFVTLVMDVLIVEQGVSIVTNVLSIRQRRNIKNEDFISRILNGIRDSFIKTFNTLLGNLKPPDQ